MNLMINNLEVSQKRYLCIPEEKTSRYPFLNVPSIMLTHKIKFIYVDLWSRPINWSRFQLIQQYVYFTTLSVDRNKKVKFAIDFLNIIHWWLTHTYSPWYFVDYLILSGKSFMIFWNIHYNETIILDGNHMILMIRISSLR